MAVSLPVTAVKTALQAAEAGSLVFSSTHSDNVAGTLEALFSYEWLLVAAGAREASMAASLRDALRGTHASVTEVGSGQTVIVLRGAAVRDLLAKECPFDLHAPDSLQGSCAQTRLAKAAVLLRPTAEHTLELIVRRSFAGYVWTWLLDAVT